MESDNPLVRLVVYSKLKKMMMGFVGKKIKPLERNMIRGLFVRNLKDFSEQRNALQRSETLYEKLMRMSVRNY
jgi:hypothetical protein